MVRDNLVKFVAIIESKSRYIASLKLSKQFLGTDQDIMTATVYIPPQTSNFFSEDEYDLFEQEIVSVGGHYEYIYIYIYLLGDFSGIMSSVWDMILQ